MQAKTSSDRETPNSDRADLLTVTFHYVNGQSQCFKIHRLPIPDTTPQDMRQAIRRFLKENWWTIKTPEKTFFINSANVLSYEIDVPAVEFEGEGVLHADLATDIRD